MTGRKIIEYVASDGSAPFRKWLIDLRDVEARARIRTRIDRLALGNAGDFRNVGGGVFELRIHCGPGYRIYFAYHGQQIALLLLGGHKETQQNDIELAQKYWADHQRRI